MSYELFFEVVDQLAEMRPFICIAMLQLDHEGLNRPFLPQIFDLEILEFFGRGSLLELADKMIAKLANLVGKRGHKF